MGPIHGHVPPRGLGLTPHSTSLPGMTARAGEGCPGAPGCLGHVAVVMAMGPRVQGGGPRAPRETTGPQSRERHKPQSARPQYCPEHVLEHVCALCEVQITAGVWLRSLPLSAPCGAVVWTSPSQGLLGAALVFLRFDTRKNVRGHDGPGQAPCDDSVCRLRGCFRVTLTPLRGPRVKQLAVRKAGPPSQGEAGLEGQSRLPEKGFPRRELPLRPYPASPRPAALTPSAPSPCDKALVPPALSHRGRCSAEPGGTVG